jgi:hypothetical protein
MFGVGNIGQLGSVVGRTPAPALLDEDGKPILDENGAYILAENEDA